MKNKHINFIPPESREKFVIPHKVFPMLMMSSVFLYVSISGISLYHHSSSAQAELMQLEQKDKELQAKIKSVNISEEEFEGARSLQNTLKQKSHWSEFFKEMSVLIPNGVWLTSFGNQKSSKLVILRGEASSLENIAGFLTILEKSHHFFNAQLVYSQKDADINPNRYHFEFSIPMQVKIE